MKLVKIFDPWRETTAFMTWNMLCFTFFSQFNSSEMCSLLSLLGLCVPSSVGSNGIWLQSCNCLLPRMQQQVHAASTPTGDAGSSRKTGPVKMLNIPVTFAPIIAVRMHGIVSASASCGKSLLFDRWGNFRVKMLALVIIFVSQSLFLASYRPVENDIPQMRLKSVSDASSCCTRRRSLDGWSVGRKT